MQRRSKRIEPEPVNDGAITLTITVATTPETRTLDDGRIWVRFQGRTDNDIRIEVAYRFDPARGSRLAVFLEDKTVGTRLAVTGEFCINFSDSGPKTLFEAVMIAGFFDPEERAAQKQASRDEDLRQLASGSITAQELSDRNSFFGPLLKGSTMRIAQIGNRKIEDIR